MLDCAGRACPRGVDANRPQNGPIMTRTIRLSDGRALAFAEHGPTDGLPVLFFHGSPASHPNWRFFGPDELLHELGIRVVAVDRPRSAARLPSPSPERPQQPRLLP